MLSANNKLAIAQANTQAMVEENTGLRDYIKKLKSEFKDYKTSISEHRLNTTRRDNIVWINAHTKTLLAVAEMELHNKNFLAEGKQVNKLRTELLKEIDRLSYQLFTA